MTWRVNWKPSKMGSSRRPFSRSRPSGSAKSSRWPATRRELFQEGHDVADIDHQFLHAAGNRPASFFARQPPGADEGVIGRVEQRDGTTGEGRIDRDIKVVGTPIVVCIFESMELQTEFADPDRQPVGTPEQVAFDRIVFEREPRAVILRCLRIVSQQIDGPVPPQAETACLDPLACQHLGYVFSKRGGSSTQF